VTLGAFFLEVNVDEIMIYTLVLITMRVAGAIYIVGAGGELQVKRNWTDPLWTIIIWLPLIGRVMEWW